MEMTVQRNALTVTPHPLTLHGQRHLHAELIPGESLHTFLSRSVDNIDSGIWVVSIGGYEVPPTMWSRTVPKHGCIIECRSVVHKDVLKLVAVIALSYFTLGAGGLGAGGLFATGGAIGGGFIAAAATFVVGSLVINKVLGPKQADAASLSNIEASPTYKLSGGNNRARPYEPIPLLFGELQVTPDYASAPYTFFEGDDQFLYSVFHAGINCGSVSGIKIGQTPLASYSEVTTRADSISGMTQQALEGWGNVDSVDGAQLLNTGTPAWVTRTSSTNTVVLQADFEGTLYAVNNSGALVAKSIALSGEFRLLPGGAWAPFFDSGSTVTLTNATTKPLRKTYSRSVASGQYEVRFRKDTLDVQGTQETNNLTFGQLKSVQPDTGTYGGMGRFGVKIRASGQINGALNEVRWISTAKPIPYWNGSGWVTATSRVNGLSNPGAQMLLYARGIYDNAGKLIAGMGLTDSQIDIESLKSFMIWCAGNNFTFDYIFDAQISHGDVLDAISAVGFGAHTWQGGKLGVSWAANDQPIEGVVNMATMKAKTFSVNYQTVETADGLEYAYYDRDRDYAWKTLRVADPDVVTPLNPARITSMGVTSESHAAILARFHLAQSIYQRKDIQYETDLEHLTYKRNSVMALTHDVTQWGYGGRVQAVVNSAGFLTLTLDDIVPAGTSSRYIGLRVPGERGYRVFGVAAFAGESREITLLEEWPAGVAVPGNAANNPASDTIWIYDFKATPGYKVRVVNIQPKAGLQGASVSVVPDSEEFWNYVFSGTYTPPVSQSLLPIGLPVISRLSVTEELQRQGNTYYVDLSLMFDVTGAYDRSEIWGSTSGSAIKKLGETRDRRFGWRGTVSDVWDIEVRPFDRIGRNGLATGMSYSVEGLSRRPANIASLSITGNTLNWLPNSELDLRGYIFKFHYGNNRDWGTAVPIHEGVITQSPYDFLTRPSGMVTIMGKAVDTSGNESLATTNIVTNLGDAPIANVVEVFDFHAEGFVGELYNCAVISGDLAADATDSFYGTDEQSAYGLDNESFYQEESYAQMSYTSGETYVVSALSGSMMTLAIEYQGTDLFIEYRLAGPTPAYGADSDSFYGDDSDSAYDAPSAWTPWPGQIIATNDVYQWRITIGAGGIQGIITALSVTIDAPDIVEYIEDVVIDAAGTVIPYISNFAAIKTITAALQANASGAITLETDKTINLAPKAKAYNVSHVAVSGATADFTLKGY